MRRLWLLVLCVSCGSTASDAPGPSGEAPRPQQAEGTVTATVPAPTPKRPARRTSRDLIAEAGRAELRDRGLFIDVGSLDQHKYSRGGWMSGWSRNSLEEQTTVARVEDRPAFVDVVLETPASELVVRARGRGSLGVSVDKGGAVKSTLGSEFALHRFALGKALGIGRHRIVLSGKGAVVDWIWAAETAGVEPPSGARVQDEALTISNAGSYSFYLIPEADTQLEVESQGEATFQVVAERDGADPLVLHDGDTGHSRPIDLSALAGHPVRLRLVSNAAMRWTRLAITEPTPAPVAPAPRPKNVILLLIDTQRADSFSVVGQGIGAKTYESLVATSTTFKNAYNNENWTKPSIATIDTGLYPGSHQARWRKDRCSSDLVFLSEHLQAQGFATGAMVSNMSAGPKFGFDQGWDLFEKTENAEHAFGRATAWLEKRNKDKPFFLYVQTIDPHVPFSVPEGAAETLFGGEYNGKLGSSFEQSEEDALNAGSLKLGEQDARWLQALYDAEVLYHDTNLGIFLKSLRESGALADTAFIILNDHGEEFGEHGRWGHGWTSGDALYRSPLLMHLPGYFPVKTFTEVVEHVDVAPTIVDALGVPAMASAEGQSLLPLLHDQERSGRAPYSALLYGRPNEIAIRVGAYKMFLEADRTQQLFDMVAEPGQNTDVIDAHPIALRLCELAFGEAVANPRRSERTSDRSTLPVIKAEFIKE